MKQKNQSSLFDEPIKKEIVWASIPQPTKPKQEVKQEAKPITSEYQKTLQRLVNRQLHEGFGEYIRKLKQPRK